MERQIIIKGAREHNLCNIDLEIPRERFVVFTGVSGSGKSSLAFDTLFAEGQRRYVESLSSYARQFLGQMEKPRVDYIAGLSPAISIEQKSAASNPRSTVGTITEIYDYLRVLYARIGQQHCYICHKPIGAQTPQQMTDAILNYPEGTKILILAPMMYQRKGEHKDIFDAARRQGFVRVRVNGNILDLDEDIQLDKKRKHDIEIVVDRLTVKPEIRSRLTDSVETALQASGGYLRVSTEGEADKVFSEKRACLDCGISFEPLSPQLFSFNSPLGMCKECNGLGFRMEPDVALIIPDENKSIRQGAVALWGDLTRMKNSWKLTQIQTVTDHFGISVDVPIKDMDPALKRILLHGAKGERFRYQWKSENGEGTFEREFNGLLASVKRHYLTSTSEHVRNMFAKFISRTPCPDCQGKKLRKESLAVTVGGLGIHEFTSLSIGEAYDFIEHLKLDAYENQIAEELLKEIRGRLKFLVDVGLHYLNLHRAAPSLSGGEAQRIRLASQIGCGLVGVLYILDEPSIGLHSRDNRKLLDTLLRLRDIGNSVIVVEHDREIIESADFIVDFGPGAGHHGGTVVASGSLTDIKQNQQSLTGKYLSGVLAIETPAKRRVGNGHRLEMTGATHNNLKSISVSLPLGVFICVTGVSGSGKSSLINETLYPALANRLHRAQLKPGPFNSLSGLEHINKVIEIDQRPIGRTPRSNPATYVKVYDGIRKLLAELPEAKIRGYKPSRFSFNVKGGRCEACIGAGVKRIEMHFLPDVWVTCDECQGKRFNRETLEVRYKGLSISDILNLEVKEAMELFKNVSSLKKYLKTLDDVGLGYIKLGQPATTLSGGEAQRVKLARELSRTDTGRTLYILDEPTTGLHFFDVHNLLRVLQFLVNKGNTIVVIEHNLDVIKCADYVIDLGPEGGDNGGYIIATGSPEELAAHPASLTGAALRRLFANEPNAEEATTAAH